MNTNHERGVALVLSLFLMSAMSVLAASLMFLSQTETYASMNYRMMSQSRYAGEAAVQKAADFLLDPAQYAIPSFTNAVDPLSNYDFTVSPVTDLMGNPIVLSAVASQPSNYPAAAVQTAFNTSAQGTLAAGNTTVKYGAYATLISMQTFQSFGGGQDVVQTWQITGVGELSGARSATVEVVATVETPKVPANNYGAFAADDSCGALYFHGNTLTNSYDSRYGAPDPTDGGDGSEAGGDIGTNGNLQVEGSVEVQGNLYTPRTGVGTCEDGGVTALTESGNFDMNGSIGPLPTTLIYPPPVFSATPIVDQTLTIDSGASLAGACIALAAMPSSGVIPGTNCFVDAAAQTLTLGRDGFTADINLPNVVIDNNYTLVLEGNSGPSQTIYINSLSGRGDVEVEANTDAGDSNEAVVLKIFGLDTDGVTELAAPFDLSRMGWKQNDPASSYDASAFQIVYGGSQTIEMGGGNSQSAVTVYAPNADFEFRGTQDLFGSVLARTVEVHGNADIHYDRRLGRDFWVAGRPMVGTFTWKRF